MSVDRCGDLLLSASFFVHANSELKASTTLQQQGLLLRNRSSALTVATSDEPVNGTPPAVKSVQASQSGRS
jgi:hypothetical protein